MAYRRPGIQVTQEFVDLLPALSAFNLPCCMVGPAFQVVSGDSLGEYDGDSASYSYNELSAGNIVDTRELDENELPDHQYPIRVFLRSVKVEEIAERETGKVESTLVEVSDSTTNAFGAVVAGDEMEIFERDIEIVALQSNGQVNDASPSTLVGTTNQFANVSAGDVVEFTGGTNVTVGTRTVLSKTNNQTLVLSSSFFTGSGTVSNVSYRISRTTGTDSQGVYKIREVVNANKVRLTTSLPAVESPLAYRILRTVSEVELVRGESFEADDTTVDIDASLELDGKDIVSAQVFSNYRALRTDLAAQVKDYSDLADLQETFGVDQIVPANPLAFSLFMAMQNTVTKVNGLGLNGQFFSNETLAYQASLDVLKRTDMYALSPLTQSPVIGQLFATHVTQMSQPAKGKERVVIINRKLITKETMADTTTTDGFRVILNTQTGGIVTLGDSTLQASSNLFGQVQPGDLVTIVGGTGVTPGVYPVDVVTSQTELVLGDGFTATYNASNVQYFIRRADGLEANGQVFYDSNAEFITDDVSSGYFLVIESGAFEGRYKITSVTSNTQLSVAQVPGVVSVQGDVTYRIERDLSVTEQAEFIAAYATSFANRRVVMTFPDVVKIPEGSQIRELPGFYFGSAVAALTTGLPTHQGFTNLTVSGFLGFTNGSDKFDEDQLDIIADGGVMIFDQEVKEAPLYIRHQLTTDRSAIKFQEYSVTKNVDFIAKFMRNAFKGYPGKYNIVEGTLDELKSTAQAVLRYLKEETVFPAIGGVIRNGRLASLEEGTNIDSIAMRFSLDIPIPLNNIDITIQV